MKLVVTTPTAVLIDVDDVRHVRAEDATGAFGVTPHHADFLTVLTISVLTFRDGADVEHHVAVRGGVLSVQREPSVVSVAAREAVEGDDLRQLEDEVLTRFRQAAHMEEASRTGAARLQLAAIRQICRYLSPGRGRGYRPASLAVEREEQRA